MYFLKELKALAPFSFLGLVGVGVTMASMVFRYFDGSYSSPGGVFSRPSIVQPSFAIDDSSGGILGILGNMNTFGGLVLACTLATAFVAHYNAPRFHAELENNSVKRFNVVVFGSYTISAIAFLIVAGAGFLTFGQSSAGFILNSYSSYDPLITLSRTALAVSIALTYPLPFFGLRDGFLDVLRIPQEKRTETLIRLLSLGLLIGITIGAYFVKDLALVLSVGGGSFSTILSSVFPALMFRSAVKQYKGDTSDVEGESRNEFDSKLSLVLMGICSVIGTIGVFIALDSAF